VIGFYKKGGKTKPITSPSKFRPKGRSGPYGRIVIQFNRVGADRYTGVKQYSVPWTKRTMDPDVIASLALEEARGHTISSVVHTVYDPKTNSGTIYAGFHNAGAFKVVNYKEIF
jgi:hypothetical protein